MSCPFPLGPPPPTRDPDPRGAPPWLPRWMVAVVFVWGTLGGLALQGLAQGGSDPERLEQLADEAVGETVWYDPESDALKPLVLKERSDDSIHRDSRWLPRADKVPKQGSGFWESWFDPIQGFFASLGLAFSSANLGSWLVLLLLVVLLVTLLVYAYSRIDQQPDLMTSRRNDTVRQMDPATLAERMEQLPDMLQRQPHDLRGAAALAMEKGAFDQAIIFLFGHQLLLLDQHHLLRLSRGKTNRQYLRETSGEPLAQAVLSATVESFEASYFGRHPLAAERFAALWRENERLESTLAQHQEAVA